MATAIKASGKCCQYTFAMLKPDVAKCSLTRDAILSIIEKNGFKIVRIEERLMSLEQAKEFYSEHKKKFFYNRLTTFMSSSPIYALILAKNDAINSWRSLMGKANVYRTIYNDPDCLRSRFGLTDTRNAVHGSDSEKTVRREIAFFYPDFQHFDRRTQPSELSQQ
jgi:nucleoside-diphosphate kinase